MNCKDFQSTLNEIAREALTDARTRAGTEAHAAECGPCAALLSDARSLTVGLRALASQDAHASAPPRLEADLLAALRARKVARPAVAEAGARVVAETETAAPAVVVPFAPKRWSWSKTFGAAGMAAAAAVAFVVLVPQLFFKSQPSRTTSRQAGSRQTSQPNAERPAPPDIIVPPDIADLGGEIDGANQKPHAPSPAVAHAPRPTRGALMTNARYNAGGARGGAARPAAASSNAANAERAEITTEFIPLAQGGGFVAGEGGHVVRVELPRSALARFGLPFNAEASGGRVKADVLIGEDGVARAIRFVR